MITDLSFKFLTDKTISWFEDHYSMKTQSLSVTEFEKYDYTRADMIIGIPDEDLRAKAAAVEVAAAAEKLVDDDVVIAARNLHSMKSQRSD